jgi:glycosyltransferase involved in cell wall biosynthesis
MNDSKKVIYTSSYDRGLEHLLEIWPDVKEAVPEAELHVYYGWTLFEKFYRNNPERMEWMDKVNKMMEHDGITHHGRVSQKEILEKMKECGVWAYPTHFGEISCITAMKAQMLGCVPIVINYAALQTTVQHGIKIEGDIYDQDIKNLFKEELIKLLKDEKKQEDIRKKMMPWAKKEYTWKKVAEQWSADFKEKK